MFKYKPALCSHLPVLAKVVMISEGPVLELGAGPFSTPLLHWLCFEQNRKLVTYENDPNFFQMSRHFPADFHNINLVEDWGKIPIDNVHWGVAFVDHAPAARRKIETARLAKIADYIVVHDTEPKVDADYEYISEILKLFKYRYDYQKAIPSTTVVSNFIDFQM